LTVRIDDPYRLIRVPRGKGEGDGESTGCAWDLGYGLSVHKSQGSEWSMVIVMLDEYPGAKMVCDRSWVYTAISRAKNRCVLIGKRSTIDTMCRRQTINNRKTFLRESILKNIAQLEMAGM
jgi:ATP-dependent exoDNAse (exonuclease V) alpha subunit